MTQFWVNEFIYLKGLYCSENANFLNYVDEIWNFMSIYLSVPSFMKIEEL